MTDAYLYLAIALTIVSFAYLIREMFTGGESSVRVTEHSLHSRIKWIKR